MTTTYDERFGKFGAETMIQSRADVATANITGNELINDITSGEASLDDILGFLDEHTSAIDMHEINVFRKHIAVTATDSWPFDDDTAMDIAMKVEKLVDTSETIADLHSIGNTDGMKAEASNLELGADDLAKLSDHELLAVAVD